MIVSHAHKFVAIGIPKTATRTLFGSLALDGDYSFHMHSTASSVKNQFEQVGLSWGSYYKLTLTRNPWDRYYSLFNFLMSRMSVKDDIKAPAVKIFEKITENAKSQDAFYCDDNGQVILDHIGKFEDVNAEFESLCGVLDFKGKSLAHLNANSYSLASYSDIYRDSRLVDYVAKKEAKVIALQGYEFDSERLNFE